MQDDVLSVKVEPTAKRALKIYCAAENKTERDVVTGALNTAIPAGYLRQAARVMKEESEGDNKK